MKFIKFSIYFILSFTILFGADYANEAKEIENKFKEVITLYKDGKNAEARQLTQQAYFGHFEKKRRSKATYATSIFWAF